MINPRLMATVAIPLALAFAALGCGGSSSSSSTNADTSEQGASTSQSGGAAAGGGQTLQTSADPNGQLKFTQTLLDAKAGSVTIKMTNPSSSGTQHGISLEGNGVDQEGTTAQPGGTATVSVANLKPGTYTFYCPVDSHKQQGMTGTLTVK